MKLLNRTRHPFTAAFLCSTAIALPAAAPAQNVPSPAGMDAEPPGSADEIVVTGSRIRRSGAESPTPTTIIDTETIRLSGVTEIADLINQTPSLFITQSNQTSNLSGNAGVNALDLRGLGTERTLVLVNGRRHVPAMPGTSAVDVSTIPANLVERVEVITGGASALYGADAVAGVVNFILKDDFEGIDTSARIGGSTRGDMESRYFDFLYGRNFASDRGNVTFFASYGEQPDAISGEDRPWTARGYPIYDQQDDGSYLFRDANRSIYDHDEAVILLGGQLYTFTADGTPRIPELGPGGIVNAEDLDLMNPIEVGSVLTDGGEFGGRYDDWLLQVPTRRFASYGTLNYDLSDDVEAFLELGYSHNRSRTGSAPRRSFGTDAVPIDSPFITDEIRELAGGTMTAPLPFTRRYYEFGPEQTAYDRSLYQVVAGFEGDLPELFGREWTWSAYYSFGETREDITVRNATASERYYLALDSVTGPNGAPVCRSTLTDPDNGCVPLNPFRELTQANIDYLRYDSSPAENVLRQQVVSAYMTGDVVELPAGPIQAVLGAEYRKESNDIGATPEYDPEHPAFDPSLGVTETSLVGEYDVTEAFAELRVPVLSDRPLFEQFSVEGAVRLSDYSTAGRTTAYKYGSEWAPVEDIRFRATYGQAVRAPNIGELFTSSRIDGLWVTDPCNDYNLANRATNTEYTAANCAAIDPGDTTTYWLFRDIISTGNQDLDVETAKTLTVGVVLQPRFLPDFSFMIDYFDIDLDGAIDAFGAQTILEKCVDAPSLDNLFCDFVNRDAGNNIESVVERELNLSKFHTRGIDFELNYRFDLASLGLGDDSGTVSVNAVYTKLLARDFTLDPDEPDTVDETAGLFGSPEWKGAVRSSWENGPVSLHWTLRHFSSMRPSATVTPETHENATTDDVFYSDFSASYDLTETFSIYGGLNNAFDREPPRVPGAEAGGANFEFGYQAGVYDVIGRTFYLGVRYRN